MLVKPIKHMYLNLYTFSLSHLSTFDLKNDELLNQEI